MNTPTPKSRLYEYFAQVGRAVSSPARLEILELLCQGEKSVEALAAEVRQKVGNTSAHLKALRSARLVEARKQGQHVFYRVADPEICTFLLSLRRVAERRIAEVREVVKSYFTEPDEMEPMQREQLLQRVRRGEVVVIDVRPEEEYRAGHLPSAISVPPTDLPRRLRKLPKDQEIVAYCRGPYCMFSRQAVEWLREHGYRAVRFDEGVIEWQAAGLPLETEASFSS